PTEFAQRFCNWGIASTADRHMAGTQSRVGLRSRIADFLAVAINANVSAEAAANTLRKVVKAHRAVP
ncbi:MAG TPA: hypothetical protein VMR25_03890, partial [Planctomycetaceae bacterium]|nr:hypothetical protein [Planctomycetaceae bacterium]